MGDKKASEEFGYIANAEFCLTEKIVESRIYNKLLSMAKGLATHYYDDTAKLKAELKSLKERRV